MRQRICIACLILFMTGAVGGFSASTETAPPDQMVRLSAVQAEALTKRIGVGGVRQLGAPSDDEGRQLYVVRTVGRSQIGQEAAALSFSGFKSEPVQLASLPELAFRDSADDRYATFASQLLESDEEVAFGPDERAVWKGYVRQPGAWSIGLPRNQPGWGAGVTVAIIDTGVDPDHELVRHRLVAGYDFVSDEPGFASEWSDLDQSTITILRQSTITILRQSTITILRGLNQSTITILRDDQVDQLDQITETAPPAFGHGTMVAGIVHRVAPDAWIMPLRAFTGSGTGSLADVIDAVYYAVDHGANVVNMSFTVDEDSAELRAAVDYATSHGVLLVGAVGNDAVHAAMFPASLASVVGVASMDPILRTSEFTNWGNDLVTLAGPGEYVVSSYPGDGWALCAGTSFSAPWVSGLLALLVEKADITPTQAFASLSHASRLWGAHNHEMGFGGLNAPGAWIATP